MQQLIDALANHKCVLFAGSGVTRDAGLPDWAGLVRKLHVQLVKEGKLDSKYSSLITDFYESRRLVPAIDMIMNLARREHIIQIMRTVLIPSKQSAVCDIAKVLGFMGIVTTNYDHVLDSIGPQHAARLTNSLEKLKQVSTAVGYRNRFLLRIHGDIDDGLDPSDPLVGQGGPFMVISTGDYAALVQGARREALILAMHSILQDYSVLFLGYSFSDPDVNRIFQFLTQHCKFAHPSWYVGLKGDSKLNLPENVQGVFELTSWDDLPRWLNTLSKMTLKVRQEAKKEGQEQQTPITLSDSERRAFLALSQYLADLQTTDLAEKVLTSAMLEEIGNLNEFSLEWLSKNIGKLIEVGPVLAEALAEAVGRYLKLMKLVESSSENNFKVIRSTVTTLKERAQAEWQKDRDSFYRSITKKLGNAPSPEYTMKLDSLLQDLCINFGQGMAEWVHRGIGPELEWQRINEVVDRQFAVREDARKTKSVLQLVFNHPTEEEIPYLYRLLGASFLANSVRLDPSAASILKSALSLYELFLDTNILLPLLIEEHDDCSSMRAIIQESRDAGVKLYVIEQMFDEMCGHRDIAVRTFNEYGGDIVGLKELAEVLGKHANCFLQGYINALNPGKSVDISWETYLEKYSKGKMREILSQFNVSIISKEEMGPPGKEYQTVLNGIINERARRARGGNRASVLNENEAQQFMYIYRRREGQRSAGSSPQAWFLSYETVLAAVFRKNISRWGMPPTFPFSAWVAFLDSRLPFVSKNPKAIVDSILRGYPSAFDLPDPVALVRKKAFGDRVTTLAEEDATQLALSGFYLVKRVEDARNAVLSRSDRFNNAAEESIEARKAAVGEISRALDDTINNLKKQLDEMKAKLGSRNRDTQPEQLLNVETKPKKRGFRPKHRHK